MSSMEWNVTVGIGRVSHDDVDVGKFADWGGVLASADQGGLELILTLPATSLRAAVATGLAIVEAAGLTPEAVEALSTDAFDRRSILTAPDKVTAPEAAEILGVTASAVRQRIQTGSIPARRTGRDWMIPRPWVLQEAKRKGHHPALAAD